MDEALFRIAHNAIESAADSIRQAASVWECAGNDRRAPHLLVGARVFLDSPGHWCCMFGDCLATAPAGYGDSPARACADFDRRWLWSTAEIDKHDAEKKGGG